MKVLHLVKTLDGADWAYKMVTHLVSEGIEVHVCLPQQKGRFLKEWTESGAQLHFLDASVSPHPFIFCKRIKALRELVQKIQPDIVHSHFVTNIILARLSLKAFPAIKRIFQVPGPLHLEHYLFRRVDLLLANSQDYWVASSRYIRNIYLAQGISEHRVFLSYYGSDPEGFSRIPTGTLREKYNLSVDDYLIGNVNYFYAPKRYLGQKKGIKNHELLLALSKKIQAPLRLVLIGNQWGADQSYFEKLKALFSLSPLTLLLGHLPGSEIKKVWADFNLAVHVPLSENCGGVIEPLMSGVPVIAAHVGGLPEVVIDQRTGLLCHSDSEDELLSLIEELRRDPARAKAMALRGEKLVRVMFDSKRTAREIAEVYRHLVLQTDPPKPFDSKAFLEQLP